MYCPGEDFHPLLEARGKFGNSLEQREWPRLASAPETSSLQGLKQQKTMGTIRKPPPYIIYENIPFFRQKLFVMYVFFNLLFP